MENLINILNEQAAKRRAENKNDEAVFCTVGANVYNISATVLSVWLEKGDIDAGKAVIERFRTEWSASLEEAKKKNDAKKICVEQTKLEALADVISLFDAARCG